MGVTENVNSGAGGCVSPPNLLSWGHGPLSQPRGDSVFPAVKLDCLHGLNKTMHIKCLPAQLVQ